MFAISGTKLDIGYEERLILKDFDMTVRKGEITTFVGPNGSGKSTLLKTLTRLISPQKGRITCCGKNLDEIPNSEFAQMVGVLPQHHIAPPGFVVKDLVSFGRVPYQAWHQTITEEDEKAICRAMEATGVWDLRDKPLVSCSGGEAQRVWIAMVLAQEPDLLFLQEHPFFKKVPNPQRKDKFQKTAQSGNNDKEEKPALICRKRANKIDNHDRLLTADLRRRGRDRLFL